jgi:hypothetical protein
MSARMRNASGRNRSLCDACHSAATRWGPIMRKQHLDVNDLDEAGRSAFRRPAAGAGICRESGGRTRYQCSYILIRRRPEEPPTSRLPAEASIRWADSGRPAAAVPPPTSRAEVPRDQRPTRISAPFRYAGRETRAIVSARTAADVRPIRRRPGPRFPRRSQAKGMELSPPSAFGIICHSWRRPAAIACRTCGPTGIDRSHPQRPHSRGAIPCFVSIAASASAPPP